MAEQAHYLGHLDALKPSLTVAENLQFWAEFLACRGAASRSNRPLQAVDLARARRPAGGLSLGRAAAAAVDRPADRAAAADLAARRADLGARRRPRKAALAELMRGHLAGGGMIIAATHAPARARQAARAEARARMSALSHMETRVNAPAHGARVRARPAHARHAARRAGRRRRARWARCFFLIVVVMVPFAVGPDLDAAVAHRPGDPVDRRAAGEPARRSTGCSPTDHEDGSLDLLVMGAHAARTGGGCQGARALADHRPAAGADRARCSA